MRSADQPKGGREKRSATGLGRARQVLGDLLDDRVAAPDVALGGEQAEIGVEVGPLRRRHGKEPLDVPGIEGMIGVGEPVVRDVQAVAEGVFDPGPPALAVG